MLYLPCIFFTDNQHTQAASSKSTLLTLYFFEPYRKERNCCRSVIRIAVTYSKTSYIYEPLTKAIRKYFPNIKIESTVPAPGNYYVFHYGDYEDLDHERLMSDKKYIANSYIYRKSLIRKHYLSNTIAVYQAKHPESILKTAYPESFQFELTYAEFLDDVLDEVYELRCELVENEKNMDKTFILKPSMTDKGQGIRLFKTIDQLQEIFDSFDEDDTDDEGDESNEGMIISQLRHFVVQEYICNPLLLPEYNHRKFHIRTYVLCSGQINVYVYDRMLLLFSAEKYINPNMNNTLNDQGMIEMTGHLTNTCLQDQTDEKVVEELEKSSLSLDMKRNIIHQIHLIVADLFKAAVNVDRMNFQPLSNAFEAYGLDFLVSDNISETTGVTLLEVNAYPDFRQTGSDLKELIDGFFEGVMAKAILPLTGNAVEDANHFNKVLEINNL